MKHKDKYNLFLSTNDKVKAKLLYERRNTS